MSIYDRRMFRMANGGGLPPDPAMAMDPAMMAGPMPPVAPDQISPGGMLPVEEDVEMAGDYEELMGAVWEEDAPAEVFRQRLAEIVGPEDAARTPESVLALVQPVLVMSQMGQMDEGIGALMPEQLDAASPNVTGEGIATLAGGAPTAPIDAGVGMPMDPMMMAAMEEEALAAPGPYPV